MEEDEEIELLLKNNEDILMEAAKSAKDANCSEEDENSEETIATCLDPYNEILTLGDSIEFDKNNSKIKMKKKGSTGNENPYRDEVRLMRHKNNVNRSGENCRESRQASLNKENCDNLNLYGKRNQNVHSSLENLEVNMNHKNLKPSCSEAPECETIKDSNYGDEIEDIVEHKIVSYIAENPSKHYSSYLISDSEEESVSDYDDDYESSYFINDIMAEDEPQYRGRTLEQIRKDFANKSQQHQNKTVSELQNLQKLFLKRDKLLAELESKLQCHLHENETKQKQVRTKIVNAFDPEGIGKLKEPSFTRCFFKKFGIPYFKDSNGFIPPPNKDYKKKIERGEVILPLLPKVRHWIKPHRQMLQDAIKQTIIDERSEKLRSEITKLKIKESDELKVNEKRNLKKKIIEHEDRLRYLPNKSYSDLIILEKDDREYDWMKYSVTIFDGIHSPEECRRFWHNYLKPSINKNSWNGYEDSKLLKIAEQMDFEDWDTIATLLGTNRSAFQCFVHYQTRLNTAHNYTSGKWTKEEDNKLISLINASKIGNFIPWTKVSTHMGNRTHTQIYNRWSKCLDPKLVKGKFSKEEDLLVVAGIEVFGANVKELSTLLDHRSSTQVRERYERYLIPKNSKTGSWSLEEDEKLLNLVEKYGKSKWVEVASEMKTRTRTQVRQRYAFIEKMMTTKPGWSIHQVQRRNVQNISKDLKRTKTKVEKVKKEIDQVEQIFNLSNLEKETFRLEKLKELRDEILLKKYSFKKKKKPFSERSQENSLLLEHFLSCTSKPPYKNISFHEPNDYDSYLNQILLLVKYFGQDLDLPLNSEDIFSNNKLNHSLKVFLDKTIDKRSVSSQSNTLSPCVKLQNRIDCMDNHSGTNDDTILMNESWHTPPVDVSRLNFHEFFKRTVFDYSYGMHKDIWESKIMRESGNMCLKSHELLSQPNVEQPFYIPPNYLTTLGQKSVHFSKARLKKEGCGKGYSVKLSNSSENEPSFENGISEQCQMLLYSFKNTFDTLFTWPKVLSITKLGLTSAFLENNIQVSKVKDKNPLQKNIEELLFVGSMEVQNVAEKKEPHRIDNSLQKDKKIKSILEQQRNLKRQRVKEHSGIQCKRKMKIEHSIQNSGKEIYRTKKSSVNHSRTRSSQRNSRGDLTLRQKGSKDDIVLDTIGEYNLSQSVKLTYSKTRQAQKRNIKQQETSEPAVKEQEIIEPAVKKPKHVKSK